MRLLRLLLKVLGGAAVLLALAAAAVYFVSSRRLHRRFSLRPASVPVLSSAAAVAEGRHLAAIRGCSSCHGDDGGGASVIDDAAMGRIYGPNLTAGAGGLAASLTDQDWVRAIRHGVATDGHPLVIMPSKDFVGLSDQDLGEIIGYFHSLPPVNRAVPPIRLGPVARLLLVVGKFRLSADLIDHSHSEAAGEMTAAPTATYGRYLASSCTGCHNPNFSGGKIAEGPPSWPPAANLTPAGVTAGWTAAQFMATLRTMHAPDGRPVNPVMPAVFGQMTDTELQALWAYLKTLPAAETGKAPGA